MGIKEELLAYLKTQKLMALATCDKQVWSAPVYFVACDDLSLYFASSDKTRHIRQIKANPEVAFSIYDSTQKFKDHKIGVQGQGTCKKLTKTEEAEVACDLWNKTIADGKKMLDPHVVFGGLFKITPTEIKFMNEPLWGLDKYRVITIKS